MRNIPAARRFAIWGDDLMGYGKPDDEKKWWYDFEDVDGTLVIPAKSKKVEYVKADDMTETK